MPIGEVLRAAKVILTPGMVINGFTDYGNVSALVFSLGHKLQRGAGRLEVRYQLDAVRDALLIDNVTFRNREHFFGRIVPEIALIIPADISLVPSSKRSGLNPDGIAFLLRYGLFSSGKGRTGHHIVACALFHETQRALVWAYARMGTGSYMESLIEQTQDPFTQKLREGWQMLVSPPG